ncbi:MAG: putative outer membrane repeat protein [Chlamydiales bacterium]|jgi:predicted outer membrane repeat protein
MKHHPFVRRVLSVVLLASLAASAPAQTVIYVDKTAPAGGDGQSWGSAFNGLIDALTVASDAGIHHTWVARGTYAEAGQFVVRHGDSLFGGFDGTEVLQSERDPAANPTVLDGQGTHRVLSAGRDTVIDGFTVMNGSWPTRGGGLAAAGGGSLTVRNVLFLGNTAAEGGGGLRSSNDTVLLINCTFRSNTVTDSDASGGGAYCYNAQVIVEDCVFEDNSAPASGGGLANYEGNSTFSRSDFRNNAAGTNGGGLMTYHGAPTFEECVFQGNTAGGGGAGFYSYDGIPSFDACVFRDNSADGNGGAVFNYSGDAVFRHCLLQGNSATDGGGVWNYLGHPQFVGCDFIANQAMSGAGLYNFRGHPHLVSCKFIANSASEDGGAALSDRLGRPRFTNCLFMENSAAGTGGALIGGRIQASLSTFVGNSAAIDGAASCDEGASVTNCVLSGNSLPQLGGTPAVSFSFIDQPVPGLGNLSGDPRLVNPSAGNFRLAVDSPCVDAGSRTAIPEDTTDLDVDGDWSEPTPLDLRGATRVHGASVDMGAWESTHGCGQIETLCQALPNSTGAAASIGFQGSPRAAQTGFRLNVSSAPPGSVGVFFYGSQPVQVPFGDGFRCIGREVYRLQPAVSVDANGHADAQSALPSTGPGAIHPGSSWSFQFWFLDPSGPGGTGFNLSDAVRVTFCN